MWNRPGGRISDRDIVLAGKAPTGIAGPGADLVDAEGLYPVKNHRRAWD